MNSIAPLDARTEPFRAGDTIALRSVRSFPERGLAVSFAVAGRVLVDDDRVAVVASPVGSAVRRRAGAGSGPTGRLVLSEDWDGSYAEDQWSGAPVVRVHPKGLPWSVWRWHDGTDWSAHWYMNLELPWVRTAIGFDSQDWTLDVIASTEPDGTWSVRFKDEDELAYFTNKGHWSASMRSTIEGVGEEAKSAALRRDFPFNVDWSGWVPDPAWPALPLHAQWREIH